MMKKVTAKASIGIQKPVSEVFEAIINPEIMQNYFISKGSGRMETGKEIFWSFPEFDGSYPVTTKEIAPNEKIIFIWDPESVVTIELKQLSENNTLIKVSEEGHDTDEKSIRWAIGQTEGWANFLACMKAWLEYEIHLRKGAFEFMKSN
ncbi:SRPBCC domain-containing protein [Epilithonimonas mollis]|uniref:Uncharacterized conserved protein YndB, AHSA1/START domain n=1 Tax=Epilithonimonas mollis TaxID=216903 RepID=A0A1M6NCY5_9FLAO|nr:SRPBCC domain-containing protein [Epilithonimonas mollis]SHJ93466.1 Uncharacterized conserved protein YndB, AHSA1/START domain [Epilithonimonas mollis]